MHGSLPDPLIARADAALDEARQLQLALLRQRSLAQAICPQARQNHTLRSGLQPAVGIALVVSAHPPWER